MPAAAVIPAPIAYIKVVAVKKLVVELQAWLDGPPSGRVLSVVGSYLLAKRHGLNRPWRGTRTFTVKKLECSKQAISLGYISME